MIDRAKRATSHVYTYTYEKHICIYECVYLLPLGALGVTCVRACVYVCLCTRQTVVLARTTRSIYTFFATQPPPPTPQRATQQPAREMVLLQSHLSSRTRTQHATNACAARIWGVYSHRSTRRAPACMQQATTVWPGGQAYRQAGRHTKHAHTHNTITGELQVSELCAFGEE